MKAPLARIREAGRKLVFCYTVTKNLSSFIKLIWFTKLYRLRKKSSKYKKFRNKFFSISLANPRGRKIFLRIYAGDIDIFYEIFLTRVYELPATWDKRVIIDAGANVGLTTLYFFQQMPKRLYIVLSLILTILYSYKKI